MIFVYYDLYENGGVGLQRCQSRDEAAEFIQNRMKDDRGKPSLENYTVIDGRTIEIEAVQVATLIRFK